MRVLIVDDDETFCQLLAEVLQNKGMQVVWTTDGLEGYDMSTQQVYDIFIVDVRMPLILGTELAEALKKDHPHAKIILVSAFADRTLRLTVASMAGVSPRLDGDRPDAGSAADIQRLSGDEVGIR